MLPAQQVNLEYWFRLIYDLFYGAHGSVRYAEFTAFLSHLWLWVIVIGYMLSVAGLFMIVYATVRLYELRKREKEFYGHVLLSEEANEENPRWKHIQELMGSSNPSDWRAAILEADIMLDDMLTRQGYTGEGIGEKLKSVDPADFATLQDAWEAHKVRNQIAHEGSSFQISQLLAQRTVARYEAVFREFELI